MNRFASGGGRKAEGGEIRHPGGFTLIEVLLAMAILAVIMTVIYVSFSTAGDNVKQAEAQRDETDLARSLITRLSNDIANAYLSSNMNSVAHVTVFYGKKEELDNPDEKDLDRKLRHDSIYLTTLTNWPRPNTAESELWEVAYYFKEKPEGKGYTLYRREKRVLGKDQPPALEGGDEYELTDRVQSLQLRYWNGTDWIDYWHPGEDTGGAGEQPSSATATLPNLPRAVEITFSLDTGKVYTTQVDIFNTASTAS